MSAMQSIPFGALEIKPDGKVVLIAEIGINHEGNVETCAKMTQAAAAAGADAIKLQTIDPDENYVPGTESYEIFSRAQLTQEETAQIFSLARSLGIEVFTTAGDPKTLDWVERLNPAAHKISSGLISYHFLIKQAARYGRSLLMSRGLADLEEVDAAVQAAVECGNSKIGLFQCTSLYPTPPEQVNLLAMQKLAATYPAYPVGLSDHALGDDAVFLSIGMGARMIEKHFTLDAGREGFDHGISLDTDGFRKMVEKVRLAETIMGQEAPEFAPDILLSRNKMLRCLVARRPIQAGERFNEENLGVKRPLADSRGIDAPLYESVLGHECLCDLEKNAPVTHAALGEKR